MRSIELFAGAGGLGIGVSQAGFESAAVIEWDRYACDTIRENQRNETEPLSHWPLVEDDVRKFDFTAWEDKIDLVSGGPPCQPFSMGGKHRGHLDDRDMFPQAIRAVRDLRPRAFLFENVKGLTRTAFSNYLEYIKLQLKHPEIEAQQDEEWSDHLSRLEQHETHGDHTGLHYHLVQRVLNAADYGVPQRRERVFLVGFRTDIDVSWAFPDPTHSCDALLQGQWLSGRYWDRHYVSSRDRPELSARLDARMKRIQDLQLLKPWRTVRDAIADLPDPQFEPSAASKYLNHQFNPGARSYPGHTGSPLDEPAKTLKAGDHGVPGGENMLRRIDGSIRYFTVREAARLQTFSDDFIFHGSWSETMRQLGNAVPVKLAELIAKDIAAHLSPFTDNQAAA